MARQRRDGVGSRRSWHPEEGFAQFDRKRIAIELMHGTKPRRFSGESRFENDAMLGPVLRIRLTGGRSPSETDVLIAESDWDGRIVPDASDGCDYCFIPAFGTRCHGRTSSASRSG